MNEKFSENNVENEEELAVLEEADAAKGDAHVSELPEETSEEEFKKSFENEDGIYENDDKYGGD